MRIDWAKEIAAGKGRFKIVDEAVQALKAGDVFVVVENTNHGIFTITKAVWERGDVIEGEPLIVWDEVAL